MEYTEPDMGLKMNNRNLIISDDATNALQAGAPLVALESTIISHGMPYPKNIETALQVEQVIRENGATPATIAIVQGKLRVGLSPKEIYYLANKGQNVIKASRRDIPFLIAQNKDGATTVAGTMLIAAMAGIRVFATGGIGGVHRGVEQSMDVSADLEELAKTNVAVVCAGVKSVLDIPRTIEYLETKGVPLIGFQSDELPAFYTRSSGFKVDYRIDKPRHIAEAMKVKWQLNLKGGIVITNPVPEEYALDAQEIEAIISSAISEMNQLGITGKATTPFLLETIADKTAGRSLDTNIQLVLNNAKLATQVAVEYAQLNFNQEH